VAEQRKYIYLCSNNHDIASNKPVTACPVISKGSPCKGTLKSIGAGSRTKTKED
jgi:hypothetical protein